MEPGHEDREYYFGNQKKMSLWKASMEPGHEDREYMEAKATCYSQKKPQWSPVMKTGNTASAMRRQSSPARLNGARS